MILNKLADYAKERVLTDKTVISAETMKSNALNLEKGDFSFEKALKKSGVSIISEVKKASPSKGVISEDFPYLDIAREYEKSGADCISVLTEPKWFLGSDDIFMEIRKNVSIPMIRKDFTVDEYQIYQAKVMGADAVLLICAITDTQLLKKYISICDKLGISALVETHNTQEVESALNAGARIIGVNNRNLKNFTVDLSNSQRLKEHVPDGIAFVAESGINSISDGINMKNFGADALLIGEFLMKSNNRKEIITQLKNG